ncbi:hypothetical protein [Leisingera sp. M658]|uniref:hypothetical protein n=1 Tax=Leisingera sp. M658 TaxID=2867015 RepID=UPI0021A3251C|nr:hypothetical protein [Leisingera sp. M658]UWQ77357.1 hypothetical protein K3724_22745 [Leisingera sp. M658]
MTRARGFKTARRKSRQRVEKLDIAVAGAIGQTVDEVHRAGLENIDAMVAKKTGRLRRFYSKRLVEKSLKGMVGYITGAARRSAFYARFVHDGTAKTKARPFHDHAVLEFEGKHRTRMQQANSIALDDRAAPSGTGRSGGGKERTLK